MKWIVRLSLFSVLGGLLVLEAFPSVLFEYELAYENFALYSQSPTNSDTISELVKAKTLLEESSIYDRNTKYLVFIPGSEWVYRVLGPDFGSGAFARTNIFDKVILRRCDLTLSLCYSNSEKHNERTLSGLIAHEVTHINLRREFGMAKEILLPSWKKEGFSDYVANSSSFEAPTETEQLAVDARSKSWEYYQYRLVATYALDVKGMSVTSYITGNHSRPELEAEMRSAYNKKGLVTPLQPPQP